MANKKFQYEVTNLLQAVGEVVPYNSHTICAQNVSNASRRSVRVRVGS